MKKRGVYVNKKLLPLSWLYGFVVFMRNKFFDWGLLKEKFYDNVHVISVGNLTVGGTGKTPHIEYLIDLLRPHFRVATLSRGYKRATKGFVLATPNSTFEDIGDEPLQIKHKFPDVIVAVDEDRQHGIDTLLEMKDKPGIILLDDAFQHRYVKPSFSILLSSYERPIYKDSLLPAGRLREPLSSMERANIVVVTKTPKYLKPIDIRIIAHEFNIYPYQSLLFTTIDYGNLISVFSKQDLFSKKELPLMNLMHRKVLLITGVASPAAIQEELGKYTDSIVLRVYPDHHSFTPEDIQAIETAYREMEDETAVVVVTEKDAVRLIGRKGISDTLKNSMYYLPIKVAFNTMEDKALFDKKINRHVRKNPRDLELH
ncbi:MAG: tetraacyldisaccharide 4'-kinase [Prevotella sp.]|jgi:tetraacyldisaccharide 4'-kinase|nr:tetraacyldisaccharide 4'-kinase [Prevotella sp.]